MSLVYLDDRRTAGDPDPAEVITTTLNGVTFHAGRRTAAHLADTDDWLRKDQRSWLRVIQPCYNSTVSASAGTHDGDGCLDVEVEGPYSWVDAERLLRAAGWAAWYRPYTPGLWSAHIHMVSIGCPGPVGIYVPGQVDDYYGHRSGLRGHVSDPSWHPDDIDSTVFDYPAFLEENDVSPEQEDRMVKRTIDGIVKALTEGKPEGSDLTRDQLIKRINKAAAEGRDYAKKAAEKS